MKSLIISCLVSFCLALVAQAYPDEGFGPVLWESEIGDTASKPCVANDLVVVGSSSRSLTNPINNFDKISIYELKTGKLLYQVIHVVPREALDSPPIAMPLIISGSKVFYINTALEVYSIETKNRAFKEKLITDMRRILHVTQPLQLDFIKFVGGLAANEKYVFINTRQVKLGKQPKVGPSVIAINLDSGIVIWNYTSEIDLERRCAPCRPIIFSCKGREYLLSPIGASKFCCLELTRGACLEYYRSTSIIAK